MRDIPIRIAVEDLLSEHVVRRILASRQSVYHVDTVYSSGGYGYLKKKARAFNNAARACPFFLLTDLDAHVCPVSLINEWLNCPKHNNFLVRVAVREIEAWLLGDATNFSSFLGIRSNRIPSQPETITDPKDELLRLALGSSRRNLRDSIVSKEDGALMQGPDYNGALSIFVNKNWDISLAAKNCPSLQRCVEALARFEREK